MTTTTTTTSKPELVSENAEGIKQLYCIAEGNRDTLNRIHELCGLKDKGEILAAAANRKTFVREEYFKVQEGAKLLYEISRLDFVYPPQIEELDRILQRIGNHNFLFVEFNKAKRWTVDVVALEAECDRRYRKFAVTDVQKSRLAFAKQYLNFVQSLGELSRRSFYGEILEYRLGQGLAIREQFIYEPYKY